MSLDLFHPIIRQWFSETLGEPTEPQRLGWPPISAGRNTLIAAPTGSGKTLSAFLVCLDRLLKQHLAGELEDATQVVYVSPLKALSNDIHRNLELPLEQIRALAKQHGLDPPPIRTAVRTGDTPQSERQKMLRRPPHILVTTPESLYLLLTAEKGRELLRPTRTVIVDEIHALARDKRGSHLALSLERLEALCDERPVRIGLSATQRPVEAIARFLVGSARDEDAGKINCEIIDSGHLRELDIAVDVPPSELSAVCSHEQWAEVYQRLIELIAAHRSTLIFVNTRRMAERISHHLTELLGEEAVASHHGSLSRETRLSAERRLKSGSLKAIVATASLEMGIDVGFIDLVCQIGSPRSITTFVQRVGRSGHSLGVVPKGRLFPLTRDELIESLALIRGLRSGQLDAIEIPVAPLDILAQQIVATVAAEEEWSEDELYDLCRRAAPFAELSRADFDEIVQMLSQGVTPTLRRGAYLHRDEINGRLRARRGARIAALTSGGAIPETAQYRVLTDGERTYVGSLDEDFAIESVAGDIFLLGSTSWRIHYVRNGEVIVSDAQGAPPNIPFWLGEAPGRTNELSTEVSRLRADIAERTESWHRRPACEEQQETTDHRRDAGATEADAGATEADAGATEADAGATKTVNWLTNECGATEWAARQAIDYVAAQKAALGLVPTKEQIVFERFFDESGGMQLVIHSPLGARVNRAWGLALRKRFCRSFNFELQASADDNGIVLSIGPQHSFPITDLFSMLGTHNARNLLEQALLAVPMFQTRWRWNITRALAVLRFQGGKKVPPYLQRFRSDDLLSAVFPQSTGCLENHQGDLEIPDHPIVRQTVHDCLHEAMDVDGFLGMLENREAGRLEFVARDTREPSPFSHELLNANPYAFLDDAPLEERRTRAVATRRGLSVEQLDDLGRLDPEAIRRVSSEAWPLVRDADELHDALMSLVVLRADEATDGSSWLEELRGAGRATTMRLADGRQFHLAAERWLVVRAVYEDHVAEPSVQLPSHLDTPWESAAALVELIRGRMQHTGPTSASRLAEQLGLRESQVSAGLEALEGEGTVLRGRFSETATSPTENGEPAEIEWCDRRLLARIHRLTLQDLRRQIKPVEPADFMRFLLRHHRLDAQEPWGGPVGVREAVAQLQGFELPAGAWERPVLAARVKHYDPQWLDELFISGEAVWGRLQPPRRDEEAGPSRSPLTRTIPISLALRDDLPWLLPEGRAETQDAATSDARSVWDALASGGALFFQQLETHTGLLPTQLEEALRQLAALGLVTCDAFGAVRTIVEPASKHRGRRRRRRPSRAGRAAAPTGRWSTFPGLQPPVEPNARIDAWCHLLLHRYGVLFRDLLARESAAPPWHVLVQTLRRMEMSGKIRGGRFVSGVGGEQYASESAIAALRKIRDQPDDESWTVISAADPLNLAGIITPGRRLPASHKNALIWRGGRCVAVKQGGRVERFEAFEPILQAEMTRALLQCRRAEQKEIASLSQGEPRASARG